MADKKKRTPFDALTLAGIPFAALCLVGGAVLTIWPGESFTYLYYAVIAVILLLGAVKLPGVFRDPGAPRQRGQLAAAGVLIAAALLLLFRPMMDDLLFQNLLALVALALGLRRVQCALAIWDETRPMACAMAGLGALESLAGIWLLARPYTPFVMLRILGIVMLAECLCELAGWLVGGVHKRRKARLEKKDAARQE